MTILDDFLQSTKLVQFSGNITYNPQGFAVLPAYTIININSSMQPLSKGNLKFLPEGTHYADYFQYITDYPIQADTDVSTLGDYFIYGSNRVYKVVSSQDFTTFSSLSVNHCEGTIVKDNRLTYDGTVLSLPYPQIDSRYGDLYQMIAMVNSCFTDPPIPTLWAFQEEIQPVFPYCSVAIEHIENMDTTNYTGLTDDPVTFYTNTSKQLTVKFAFYAYDQVQSLSLMEQFKLNYVNFTFDSNLLQWMGFEDEFNQVDNELYEDRTIFHADCKMRFSWIVEQKTTNSAAFSTIDTVAFALSIPPLT